MHRDVLFVIVGLPGVALAAWLATLREPIRRDHGPDSAAVARASAGFVQGVEELAGFIGSYPRMCVALLLGSALFSILGYTDAWYPELFIRTWGWTPSQSGLVNGASSLLAGPLGLLFAGWYSSRLMAAGQGDACLRLTAYGAIGITLPAILMPLAPTPATMALLLLPLKFFVGFPPVLIPAAIQMVAPNRLRGQLGALFLFTVGIIGVTCGPILPALFTDYLFNNRDSLRYSLAWSTGLVGPLAFGVLWSGVGQYRVRFREWWGMRMLRIRSKSDWLVGLALLACWGMAAAAAGGASAAVAPEEDGDARAPVAEIAHTTQHVVRLGGKPIAYEATAGTLTLRADDGAPIASMFYVAYTVEPAKGAPQRPLTFFFNGGPGSASLWLNIGGFGPLRAVTATPHATAPAPYVFEANQGTLLDQSDLVFLDAIGTGYSRTLGKAGYAQFWSVDGDVDAFSRAVSRYVEINKRWNSPKFLFGESYGTTRAAALAYKLHIQDIDLNGVILQSSLLNFARLQPGLDEIYIDSLPTYAAAAWAHGRAAGAAADQNAFLDEVRSFARGPYAAALAKGDRVSKEEEDAVARQMSRYLGVAVEYLERVHLRVEMESFRKELLRDQGLIIGRFDARFSGPDPGTTGQYDPATDDPATAGVNGAYLAAFRNQLAVDLGFTTNLTYRALYNAVIEPRWDMHHKAPGIDEPLTTPNTALDLAAVMGANPHRRVLSLNGLYDLSTPFFGTEYDLAHLLLPPGLRDNITIKFYASGHQTYADPEALRKMKVDLDSFYATALRP